MWIVGIFFAGVILSSWILPWINRSRIKELEEEVARLKSYRVVNKAAQAETPPQPKIAPRPMLEYGPPAKETRSKIFMPKLEKPETKPKERFSFEQVFGARLPVWIGGIALILAGFFMVKYSIETGLITERVRIIIGIVFGLGLLYSGQWIRGRENFANGQKISQALTGAGIADLYICLYAATSLYYLVPQLVGFIGMAAVTTAAVILSIRHGAPIALLGLVGGFLTPAIIGSREPDAPLLFIYLYFVLTGLLLVIRKQNWWMMAFPTIIGAFGWVAVWLTTHYVPDDTIWLGLFLIAISATMVAISRQKLESEPTSEFLSWPSALNYLSLGGAFVLMGVIGCKGNYGVMEWGLFGLLSSGGIALAYFKQKLYGFLPLASMAVNVVMLFTWDNAQPDMFALTLAGFALLYIASGYVLMWKGTKPLSWAGLCAATSLGYFLLAYYRLHETTLFDSIPMFWGFAALALCGAAITAISEIQIGFKDNEKTKQQLLAIFASVASAFLAIALTIELKREFLSVAIAAEVLAIAWISSRVEIKALRYIAAALACVFGFLLIPQVILLVQLTVYSLVEQELNLQEGIPIVNWPIFQLGLPALMFAVASKILRNEKDGQLIRALEVSAIALVGVMGYYLTRHAFHINENVLFVKAGFIERGVITNILFVYGLSCLFFGRYFNRQAIFTSGIVLCGVSLFRIIYFDLIAYNPIWAHQNVGELPLLNGLLLPYGLPAIWSYIAAKELTKSGKANIAKYLNSALLLFAFTFVSFNVRQIFQGAYLDGSYTSNAETYTYSVVWLLLGLSLLFLGALKKDQMIRMASLMLMIVTVGKVFLYDASELTGLYRVFSFLGLGLSLLGISWFYTRFVFGKPSVVESKDSI